MTSQLLVEPSSVEGSVTPPPSKSHTLRAIHFAALAQGDSVIDNGLLSPDSEAMVAAWRLLGVDIHVNGNAIHVRGCAGLVGSAEDVLDAGNSGIVLRFVGGAAALSPFPIVLSGDYSLRHNRPMEPLLSGLRQLGAMALSTKGDGFAPVVVQGPLVGGVAQIDGADSQPVSALLIAARGASKPVELLVDRAGERPWVEMTLWWLGRLGVAVEHEQHRHYRVMPSAPWPGFAFSVPADWSSAAFPAAAALVSGGSVTLYGLDGEGCQGDRHLFDIFAAMGAAMEYDGTGQRLTVQGGGSLRGVDADLNDCIDALPVLSAVCCYARGPSRLYNCAVATTKECNRPLAIAGELTKMGARVEWDGDSLTIFPSKMRGASLAGHGDHRIAMACAVAALAAEGPSTVSGWDCVRKTYPHFVHDFRKLNAVLHYVP